MAARNWPIVFPPVMLPPNKEPSMKFMILFSLLFAQSVFACDIQGLRQEVQNQFKKDMPMKDGLGEQRAVTNIEEVQVTDSLMNIRGENFFMTKLVFKILWADGKNEKREILFASVVDLGTCKLEEFGEGELVGSSISEN